MINILQIRPGVCTLMISTALHDSEYHAKVSVIFLKFKSCLNRLHQQKQKKHGGKLVYNQNQNHKQTIFHTNLHGR